MSQQEIRDEVKRLREKVASLEDEIDATETEMEAIRRDCPHPDPLPIGDVGFHCKDCGRLWHKEERR